MSRNKNIVIEIKIPMDTTQKYIKQATFSRNWRNNTILNPKKENIGNDFLKSRKDELENNGAN